MKVLSNFMGDGGGVMGWSLDFTTVPQYWNASSLIGKVTATELPEEMSFNGSKSFFFSLSPFPLSSQASVSIIAYRCVKHNKNMHTHSIWYTVRRFLFVLHSNVIVQKLVFFTRFWISLKLNSVILLIINLNFDIFV